MQPFGRNRYGPKIGVCVPLWGRGAGSPSNTMWPDPRPTCMPSFILIHPTVWPQYTNVADRTDNRQTGQTGRQRTDSIGRTVLQTVAQKRTVQDGTGQEKSQKGYISPIWGEAPIEAIYICLLYTSPSPRDRQKSRMPSSA